MAVVVSIVGRNNQGKISGIKLSNLDPKEAINTGILVPDPVPDIPSIELSLQQNECPDSTQPTADVMSDASKQIFNNESIQPNLDVHLGLSENSSSESNGMLRMCQEFLLFLWTGRSIARADKIAKLLMFYASLVDTANMKVAGDQALQVVRPKNISECLHPGEKVMPDKNEDKVVASGAKRKRMENSGLSSCCQ